MGPARCVEAEDRGGLAPRPHLSDLLHAPPLVVGRVAGTSTPDARARLRIAPLTYAKRVYRFLRMAESSTRAPVESTRPIRSQRSSPTSSSGAKTGS